MLRVYGSSLIVLEVTLFATFWQNFGSSDDPDSYMYWLEFFFNFKNMRKNWFRMMMGTAEMQI